MTVTKTEQAIIEKVRHANTLGALAGLGVSPDELNAPSFTSSAIKDFRFVKRLYDAGKLCWQPYCKLGAGWILPAFLYKDGKLIELAK